jgi:tetratricopeptide (TPR) repeat protein
MLKVYFFLLKVTIVILISSTSCNFQKRSNSTELSKPSEPTIQENIDEAFHSPLGKMLFPSDPPKIYVEKYKEAIIDYHKDSTNLDNIIWLGRRTAYLGKYRKAINIYTRGASLYPDEPRLYRHRGHRYISIREFDKAISDLEIAARLIKGQENQIEQDGLPNSQNIPISTLHGNIWYHLGLAYYLKYDFENAFRAYSNGRDIGENDDNIVSTTHWLYMIQKRLGNDQLAEYQLDLIHDSMNIIENQSYYDLCRFYKGVIPRDSLLDENGTPAGDAVKYGLANWDLFHKNMEAAKERFQEILDGPSWSSFGYIAAEKDFLTYFPKE